MNKNLFLIVLIALSSSFLFGSFFLKDSAESPSTNQWITKKLNMLQKDSENFDHQFEEDFFDPNQLLMNRLSSFQGELAVADLKSIYAECFDQLLSFTTENIEEDELVDQYLTFYKKELTSISEILPQSDWVALTRVNNHLNSSIISYTQNNDEELLRSLTRLRNSFEHQIESSSNAELVKYP